MAIEHHATQRLADAVDNLIALVVRHQGDALWQGVPLTPAQRIVLRLVCDDGPLRLQEVAARLGETQSKVSRIVTTLRDLHLVRTTTDASDGRAIQIAPTEAGSHVIRERHERLVAAVAEAFRDTDEADQLMLSAMLERLEPLLHSSAGSAQALEVQNESSSA